MKKTNKNTEATTSVRARRADLKRIPRRHATRPDEITLADCKVRITMYLDADILEYFKKRAQPPNAAPYQTQINNELRAIMERDQGDPYAVLINDERFIAAVATRVQERK